MTECTSTIPVCVNPSTGARVTCTTTTPGTSITNEKNLGFAAGFWDVYVTKNNCVASADKCNSGVADASSICLAGRCPLTQFRDFNGACSDACTITTANGALATSPLVNNEYKCTCATGYKAPTGTITNSSACVVADLTSCDYPAVKTPGLVDATGGAVFNVTAGSIGVGCVTPGSDFGSSAGQINHTASQPATPDGTSACASGYTWFSTNSYATDGANQCIENPSSTQAYTSTTNSNMMSFKEPNAAGEYSGLTTGQSYCNGKNAAGFCISSCVASSPTACAPCTASNPSAPGSNVCLANAAACTQVGGTVVGTKCECNIAPYTVAAGNKCNIAYGDASASCPYPALVTLAGTGAINTVAAAGCISKTGCDNVPNAIADAVNGTCTCLNSADDWATTPGTCGH